MTIIIINIIIYKKIIIIIIIDRIGVVQQKHCDDFNLLYYLEKKNE